LPLGYNILMTSLADIKEQCSSDADKKRMEKDRLQNAEGASEDPFVRKKMQIQQKVEDTKAAIEAKRELASEGRGTGGSVEGVKKSAEIRRSIKELRDLKKGLEQIHNQEVDDALRKARKKKGEQGVALVEANSKKRDEILDVINQEIAGLEYDEKQSGVAKGKGGSAARGQLVGNRSRQPQSRPKPPPQSLSEMDAGCEGLDQAFMQIEKNDQEIDQDLDLIHDGVKILGVMAQQMGEEAKIQSLMLEETNQKASDVNESLVDLNKKMKEVLDKSKDKGCMTMICVILILAICGYIYKMVAMP